MLDFETQWNRIRGFPGLRKQDTQNLRPQTPPSPAANTAQSPGPIDPGKTISLCTAKESVSFVFRINEIGESADRQLQHDINGHWKLSATSRANHTIAGGATDVWWLCNGINVQVLEQPKIRKRATLYKAYSLYYMAGKGFMVLRGNAVDASCSDSEVWFSLCFDHYRSDYSSYLTNAGCEPALLCRQANQQWVKMLLPDICHGSWEVAAPYGGLKGELAIFLGLIAFAITMDRLRQVLPSMFHSGQWQEYKMAHGRKCTDNGGVGDSVDD